MSGTSATIYSRRVIFDGSSSPQPASVTVERGKIARIEKNATAKNATVDLGDTVLMPGIVDCHAHINEPGRTEWEGFETATQSALTGGITTVIDMPLNSIPATTTLQALHTKAQAAQGKCAINYGFWGGVVPGNAAELEPMIKAGVMGFKAFLIDSGVSEFPMAREKDLREAMPILARHKVPLLVHAELDGGKAVTPKNTDPAAYAHYLQSRPPQWEVDAIRLMIKLSRETKCRVHIVHLSAADALDDLKRARAEGVPITVETCPHYLTFAAEEIAAGATPFKCAPPIRDKQNRERLWGALQEGVIDFVVSDHSPCTPSLKCMDSGDFDRAWGGIAGLQLSSAVLWTEMRQRKLSLSQLVHWTSGATSKFLGVESRKGRIQVGADADLVAWNPDATQTVAPEMIRHRHKVTPYQGRTLHGVVEKTWVRGMLVYDTGTIHDTHRGEVLHRV